MKGNSDLRNFQTDKSKRQCRHNNSKRNKTLAQAVSESNYFEARLYEHSSPGDSLTTVHWIVVPLRIETLLW